MEPRARAAVSTYLELFILIGVVVGGSVLVYATTTRYMPVAQGPGVTVSQASIRQGLNQAVERMIIANTGTVSFSSFTITTVGIVNAQFYVTLVNVATSSSVTPSLASGTTGDNSITETVTISPGQSTLATVTVVSASEFTVGARYSILVGASAGTQEQIFAVVVPA